MNKLLGFFFAALVLFHFLALSTFAKAGGTFHYETEPVLLTGRLEARENKKETQYVLKLDLPIAVTSTKSVDLLNRKEENVKEVAVVIKQLKTKLGKGFFDGPVTVQGILKHALPGEQPAKVLIAVTSIKRFNP